MDLLTFETLLTAPYAAWLPEAALMRWAMHLSWGVVLGVAGLGLGRALRWGWRRQWALALGAILLVFLPGAASPSYWLGLAFQAPSLTALGLCALLIWRSLRRARVAAVSAAIPIVALTTWHWRALAIAAVGLGWVLLLDMLAWWPVSVYAFGFSPVALMLVSGLTLLLWLVSGASRAGRHASLALAAVLTVFALTRLPSGNLWDALLDPWLWLVIQVTGLVALLRCRAKGQ